MNRGSIFKIVLGVVLIGNTAAAESLYISANVQADVFADEKFVGKTPLLLSAGGRDIVLRKPGYRNAAVVPRGSEEKRIMSTTFGDPPRDKFLLADRKLPTGLCHRNQFDPFSMTSYEPCLISSSPTNAALSVMTLPSQVTRFSLPYRATYYAPQQVYVYMIRENGQGDDDDWMLRRYVVNNFGEFVTNRGPFLVSVSQMTGLPKDKIADIVIAHPEPAAAANAIAEQARRKR